jgi:hypothetical protein
MVSPEPARERLVSSATCLTNIGAGERRKRLAIGVALFGASLALLGVCVGTGIDRWWRLALLPLFWGAALGVFQWRAAICIQLAARGTRNLVDTIERIEDPAERTELRRRARRVSIQAAVGAALLTCGALALPR